MNAFVQLVNEPAASFFSGGNSTEAVQIKLQALRADLEPRRGTGPSDAFHELSIQHGAVPRLWISPFEFVTIDGEAGIYRLQTERGGWQRTLFATPARCEVIAYLRGEGSSLRLRGAASAGAQVSTYPRLIWPAVSAALAVGAACGAALVYMLIS